MNEQALKRCQNALAAASRAQDPKFRQYWRSVFDRLFWQLFEPQGTVH